MLDDLRGAFAFLTILPVGQSAGPPARNFAYYPLVGLVIGVMLVIVMAGLPASPDMRAFVGLVGWAVITGGLHLDGFGDTCDGVLATATPERRLAILKDPRAGTWAVVGLALLLLGKWLALRGVALPLLVLPPVLGRWLMVVVAAAFPPARADGLGAAFRDSLGRAQVVVATGTALLVLVVLALVTRNPIRIVIITLVVSGLALLFARWAASRLGGGLTGDVYGALCELTELLCLLGLNASGL